MVSYVYLGFSVPVAKVLILIVMDNGLLPFVSLVGKTIEVKVLILIVMDNGLLQRAVS